MRAVGTLDLRLGAHPGSPLVRAARRPPGPARRRRAFPPCSEDVGSPPEQRREQRDAALRSRDVRSASRGLQFADRPVQLGPFAIEFDEPLACPRQVGRSAVLTPRWSRNARTASAARLAPFWKAVDDNL